MAYEQKVPYSIIWLKFKVEMFESGHTFDYLNSLSIDDIGQIMSVKTEINKATEKIRKRQAKLNR